MCVCGVLLCVVCCCVLCVVCCVLCVVGCWLWRWKCCWRVGLVSAPHTTLHTSCGIESHSDSFTFLLFFHFLNFSFSKASCVCEHCCGHQRSLVPLTNNFTTPLLRHGSVFSFFSNLNFFQPVRSVFCGFNRNFRQQIIVYARTGKKSG